MARQKLTPAQIEDIHFQLKSILYRHYFLLREFQFCILKQLLKKLQLKMN